MMNTAQNTKDRIVELGRDYMQKIGYHSFNYKQIALELNIKNASIHHYYPSKEDLGLAVIEKDRQDFIYMTQKLKKAKAMDRLEGLIANYEYFFMEGRRLCVIGTFSTSYNEITERMQLAVSQYAELVISWLTATLKDGLESGEFSFKESVEDLAKVWMAMMPGALLVGRTSGKPAFEGVINALRQTVKSC